MVSRECKCCFCMLQTMGLMFSYVKPYLCQKFFPHLLAASLLLFPSPCRFLCNMRVNLGTGRAPVKKAHQGEIVGAVLCFITWLPQKRKFYVHIQFMISPGNHSNFKGRQFMVWLGTSVWVGRFVCLWETVWLLRLFSKENRSSYVTDSLTVQPLDGSFVCALVALGSSWMVLSFRDWWSEDSCVCGFCRSGSYIYEYYYLRQRVLSVTQVFSRSSLLSPFSQIIHTHILVAASWPAQFVRPLNIAV
jgi:hypothetical protein